MLTAARTAGTLLHAGKHKTLVFLKIDARVHEHVTRSWIQKELETVDLVGDIARCFRFGYVHSQGRASPAGYQKYPNTITRLTLLVHNFLKLIYCVVSQTNHTSSSTLLWTCVVSVAHFILFDKV
jgi:hypothetical protein